MKRLELNAKIIPLITVVCGGCSAVVFAMHLFGTVSLNLTFVLAMWFVLMVMCAVCYGISPGHVSGKMGASFWLGTLGMITVTCALGFFVSMLRGNLNLMDCLPEISLACLSIAGFVEVGHLYALWREPVVLECNNSVAQPGRCAP